MEAMITLPNSIDPSIKHVPGSPEMYGVKFRSACRCGYPGAERNTPSDAYRATQTHADHANRHEAAGEGSPAATSTAGVLRDRAAARSPRKPSGASRRATPGGGTCGCGCGESCGGRFRPGHDAKLLSRLQNEVRTGVKTRDEALAELADHPKLKDKLAGRLA